jgi:hypothetical protein
MGLKDHRGSIHFDNLGRCGFRHGVADGLANLGAPHMQIELVPMRGVGQAQSWEQLLRVPRLPILRSSQEDGHAEQRQRHRRKLQFAGHLSTALALSE